MSKEISDLDFTNLNRWNYRIVRHKIAGGEYYRVHEVYYDKAGKPIIMQRTQKQRSAKRPTN